MSTPQNSGREHPSTYIVQDRSNEEELKRLQIQDHMITASMGGVLPEQQDPTIFRRVLDVGCGTGAWLIEMAKTYPGPSTLVGIDVSSKMVTYARAQAEARGVGDRVQFHVMDALSMLQFPDGFFDLVNQRFGMSYLRTWDWPKLLGEYHRVLKRGGMVRVTESDMVTESSSSTLLQLAKLLFEAFCQAGHFFTPNPNGVTSGLARVLQQADFRDIHTHPHAIEYRAGTAEGQAFAQDMQHLFRTIVPYLRKWTRIPDNYEELYQQALNEIQQPDFVAIWRLLTAWGMKR